MDGASSEPAPSTHDPAAFTRTSGLAFEASVDDLDAVRDAVAARRPPEDAGTTWLVDDPAIATATLFASEPADRLRLYLELTEDRRVPVLRRRLADGGVLSAGSATATAEDLVPRGLPGDLLFHMHNPARPGEPADPDVVTVGVPIEPGWRSRVLERLPGLRHRLAGTWPARRLARSSARVLAEERMWTESIWVGDGGATVRWYMEAADLDAVVESAEDDDSWITRVAGAAAERLAGTTFDELTAPAAASDWTVLVHATSPDRP